MNDYNKMFSNIVIPEILFVDNENVNGVSILNAIKEKNKNKVTLLKLLEDSSIFPLNFDGKCVIFDKYKHECIKNSVGSHSISCGQNLEPISDKNKKVYQIHGADSYYGQAKNKGQSFHETPISRASVFLGFCCKHEALFSNIDHGINVLNDDDIYWAYYRELIFYFMKLKNNIVRAKYLYKLLDKLKLCENINKDEYEEIDNISYGFYYECIIENRRKNECFKILKILDDNVDENKKVKEGLLYIRHFEYEGTLPFTFSGLFNINLENIDDNKNAFYITATTSMNKTSLITLSCFAENNEAIKQIDNITSQPNVLNTVFKLSFSMENCYYNIEYINMDKKNKERIKDYFNKDTFLRFNAPYSKEYIEHFNNILKPFDFININNKLIKSY